MPESPTTNDMIAAYERGIDELNAAVKGMSHEQLVARPIAGKWSTLEVVCHLVDSEVFLSDRIVRTLALDKPLLMSVDERPYPERCQYQSLDLTDELALFTALRRRIARILQRQTAQAWDRTGVHSEMGLMTVRQIVAQATRHVPHHLKFIAEKRAALTC